MRVWVLQILFKHVIDGCGGVDYKMLFSENRTICQNRFFVMFFSPHPSKEMEKH